MICTCNCELTLQPVKSRRLDVHMKKYCILTRNNSLRSLTDTIDAVSTALDISVERATEIVYADNEALLEEFGCVTDRLKEEGFSLFLSISTAQSFSAWSNEEDGSSGVSAKKLIGSGSTESILTPGAVLALFGLLSRHPDAHASGSLSMGWSNPPRRSSRR